MRRGVSISLRHLVFVVLALLVLTGASWALSYAHLPGLAGVLVALAIASVKVALVMLFFMELAEHRGGVRLVALVAPAFVALLTLFMLFDVWTR